MKIDPDSVPNTVSEAVNRLYDSLNVEEIAGIKKLHQLGSHHGFGTFLRNSWSLWEDTPLKRDAVATYGIAHADDISSLIRDWVVAKVCAEELDPHEVCERFHEHWERNGTDSLKAAGWPPNSKAE